MADSDLDYKPLKDVFGDLEVTPIPDSYVPLSCFIMVKALDEDGDVTWIRRSTKDLTQVEELGAIHAARVILEKQIMDNFIPYSEEEDND